MYSPGALAGHILQPRRPPPPIREDALVAGARKLALHASLLHACGTGGAFKAGNWCLFGVLAKHGCALHTGAVACQPVEVVAWWRCPPSIVHQEHTGAGRRRSRSDGLAAVPSCSELTGHT